MLLPSVRTSSPAPRLLRSVNDDDLLEPAFDRAGARPVLGDRGTQLRQSRRRTVVELCGRGLADRAGEILPPDVQRLVGEGGRSVAEVHGDSREDGSPRDERQWRETGPAAREARRALGRRRRARRGQTLDGDMPGQLRRDEGSRPAMPDQVSVVEKLLVHPQRGVACDAFAARQVTRGGQARLRRERLVQDGVANPAIELDSGQLRSASSYVHVAPPGTPKVALLHAVKTRH
jgi:hypothetical protein